MKNLRASRAKEFFDLMQLFRRYGFKHAESERLRKRRSDAVKHRVRAGHFSPRRTAIRKCLLPRLYKFDIAQRFNSLEPASQIEVSKGIHRLMRSLSEPRIAGTHHNQAAYERRDPQT